MRRADLSGEDAASVEAAALRLLASREHARAELERKLRARRCSQAAIDTAIDSLQRQGLLSEARFVEGFVRQRIAKGYGPLRIHAELAERGLPDSLIEQGLAAADVDWWGELTRVARRRFGNRPDRDHTALAKHARLLQQRGFPVGLVRRYLSGQGLPD